MVIMIMKQMVSDDDQVMVTTKKKMMMLAKVEMVRKMDNRAFKPAVFNAQRIWAVPALHTVSVRQIQYYTQTCVCDANTMWYTNILTARVYGLWE